MARIKICGIRRTEDAEYINQLKPDYCGFILADGFRRSIDYDTASRLSSMIDGVEKIGVFVDDDLDKINSFLDAGIIDIVQLHGNESPELCDAIDAPVIKVLKPDSFYRISDYEACVDYFMFDSGTGSGKVFDWSNIPDTSVPYFLAGGLDDSNIEQAIKVLNPFAVDLSSSVETDGAKDYDKIYNVLNIVRSISNE